MQVMMVGYLDAFLKQFDTLFDYDEKKVYFDRSDGSEKRVNDKKCFDGTKRIQAIKGLIIFLCLGILIISICIMCYVTYTILKK